MNLSRAALAFVFCAMMASMSSGGDLRHRALSFDDLDGWSGDDHGAALVAFVATCKRARGGGWDKVCKAANGANARGFFEANFTPVLIEDGNAPLFTGYYEPEISASRNETPDYRYPLYGPPPELQKGKAWLTRAEIDGGGALKGRGLELAWLADPVETFFLHVQGSARLAMTDGTVMRVGFGGRNGHEYRSVGKEMARRGLLPEHRVSAGRIKAWVRDNPKAGAEVLWHNPSYIFFREIEGLADTAGPVGAMQSPVTALRSIAVDPEFVPLGAPVWIEKDGANPIRSLMIAQDTGAAIKGAQRADVFYGSGPDAGAQAGTIRDMGRMVVLLPRGLAAELTSN